MQYFVKLFGFPYVSYGMHEYASMNIPHRYAEKWKYETSIYILSYYGGKSNFDFSSQTNMNVKTF